jgi:hypothetical protein
MNQKMAASQTTASWFMFVFFNMYARPRNAKSDYQKWWQISAIIKCG